MEVFPTLDSCDGGHAMFIIKTLKTNTPTFYVFDDSNCIDEFQRFVSSRNIAKIIIRNIDETSIHQLGKLWGHNTFTVRMNGSWEISNATGAHQRDIEEINKGLNELKKHAVERDGVKFISVQPLEHMQMNNIQHTIKPIDEHQSITHEVDTSSSIFNQRKNTLDLQGGNRRFWSSQTSIRGAQNMETNQTEQLTDSPSTQPVETSNNRGSSRGLIISVILNFILIIVLVVDAIFAVKMYKQVKACNPAKP